MVNSRNVKNLSSTIAIAASLLAASIVPVPAHSELSDTLGMDYFSFFNGPGLTETTAGYSPNNLGLPSNGINIQNIIALKWKISEKWAVDFQTRFYVIFNNGTQKANFTVLRWESPKLGISGDLLRGDDWSLKGAINTEFPHFFPAPFSGYQVQQRKSVFNPGLFAKYSYKPKGSPWSVFAVVSPRVYFYADRTVAEPELSAGGSSPLNKPEIMLSFMPTLNYELNPSWKLSVGVTLDYRKQVTSDWNPFNASLSTNGEGPAWRLKEMPIAIGVTHKLSKRVTIFPFITAYPIAAQRIDANTGRQATFWESASIGMWMSGTLF